MPTFRCRTGRRQEVLAAEAHLAGVGLFEAASTRSSVVLPSPRAEQRQELLVPRLQRHVVQRREAAELLGDPADLQGEGVV
jgi:hypothetical protein